MELDPNSYHTASYHRTLVVHYNLDIKVEAANRSNRLFDNVRNLAKPENAAVWFQLWGSRMAAKRFWPHGLQPIASCNRLNTRISYSIIMWMFMTVYDGLWWFMMVNGAHLILDLGRFKAFSCLVFDLVFHTCEVLSVLSCSVATELSKLLSKT